MKGIREEIGKKIYINILKAIFIITYGILFNLAYDNLETQILEREIQIVTMILLFVSIYYFEKAFNKDDGQLAIQGIEVLVISAFTLTIEHITNRCQFEFKPYILSSTYIFAIYFVLKATILYTKGRFEFSKTFSDIKEIVKEDEPIKKEATKKKKDYRTEKLDKKDKLEKRDKSNKREKEKNIS